MRKQIRNEIVETLSVLESKFKQIKETSQTAMLVTCVVLLQSIKNKCKKNLSGQRFLYYTEIFDGILLALQKRERLQHDSLVEVCDLCTELLQVVTKELLQEKEVKKEILFLPYKASMWDSLESIWRAAAADSEHCEAYVVPIPYGDRSDESATVWHCEADAFPDYVPVMDYKKYDIAKRKPDVIYIHNPYDEYNRVTSVDSHYYSRELKKHTNMLVYVPYFIAGSRWPEGQAQFPCYEYMDKMIVQQDQMQIAPMYRSQILEQNVKYMNEYIPEEKLVPLGSPKADRIFFCEKNKKIPVEWNLIIQGKKVILYNVSISGMLQEEDKALQKMKYIFECFVGRTDVVILWRPHPLLESTMKSMRSELYKTYKNLKNVFVKNHIGILDETADIDMAVAIADAYVGESSSSVPNLFGIAAKPIFFTDDMLLWKNPTAEELASVQFNYMFIEDEEAWFIAEGYNTLCKMHIVTGKIEPVIKLEDFHVNEGLYNFFMKIDDTIYFSPANAKVICEYTMSSHECKKIPFENPLEWGNFRRIIAYKNYLFMIPWRYSAILRLDRNTGECKYYKECMTELLKYQGPGHEEFLGEECVNGNTVLLPAIQANKILEFNMETEEFCFYDLPGENVDCWKIIEDDEPDVYWLLPWKATAIRKWNKKTNTCDMYDAYPENYQCAQECFGGEIYKFSWAVKLNNAIWLFPLYGNMILRFDLSNGKIEQMDILPHGIYDRKSNFYMQQINFFYAGSYKDKIIVALSAYDRSLLFYNTETGESYSQPCRLTEQQVQDLSIPMGKSFGQIGKDIPYATNENHLWRNVNSFIEYVIKGKHNQEAQKRAYMQIVANADGTCGQKVHKYIMAQVDL